MNFSDFKLKQELLQTLTKNKFMEPTQIQEKCIPLILEGKDVVGQSKTGSGKTAAFGLPILEKVDPHGGIQVIILTPTRELCVQVTDVLELFGKPLRIRSASVYGGVGIAPQMDAIKQSQIIVGTPGRVLDHIGRGTLNLSHIKFMVLDEVDRMADMGFIEDVEKIISYTPKSRQSLLFSATLTPAVLNVVHRHLIKPITIRTEIYVDKSLLRQIYYNVVARDKFSLLIHLLRQHLNDFCIIFCATRDQVDVLSKNLKRQGLRPMAIHGGITQNKRQRALDMLKEEQVTILVATDVAARGLDIRNVNYIYNYDVPKTSQDYIHRIGRTARAGSSGQAITILSDRDHENFGHVLEDRSIKIECMPTPEFERVRFDADRPGSDRGGFTQGRSFQGHGNRDFGRRGDFQQRGGPVRRGPSSGRSFGRAPQTYRKGNDSRQGSGNVGVVARRENKRSDDLANLS